LHKLSFKNKQKKKIKYQLTGKKEKKIANQDTSSERIKKKFSSQELSLPPN